MRNHRTTMGKHFSEGARMCWLRIARKKWDQAELARRISEATGEPVSSGTVCRWLYGDRRPQLKFLLIFRELLKVPLEAWEQKPTEAFEPPAAVAA